MKRIFLLCLPLVLFLAACQPAAISGEVVRVAGGSYTNISADQLHTMLRSKDFTLVNVHIPFAGKIAKTDVSIAYDQIEQNLSLLPADKSAKIVLYCRGGRMSEIAAERLVAFGYTNIWNLKSGMMEWEGVGYELEK